MKNWKTKKTDYWATAITMTVGVMTFMLCLDLAVAFLGIERVASMLGII